MSVPVVSIIIPVGPAHRQHAAVALASCLWQTFASWESVLVNDSGERLPVAQAGRIRVIDAPAPQSGKRRSSIARNAGLAVARGEFTVFLDADDYLLPTALERLIRGHAQHDAAYSYGWHFGLNREGVYGQYRSPEYDREKLKQFNLHPITALVPTVCARDVGGCDEETPGLEDWTFWLRLAQAGYCGQQIYGPTFVYCRDEGVNHILDVEGGTALMDAVRARYQDESGEMIMAGCGCGGGAARAKQVAQQLAQSLGDSAVAGNGLITLEFTGATKGAQWFTHPDSKRQIRAGGMPTTKYVQVPPEDADYYISIGLFVRVPPPQAFVPPPDPALVAAGNVAESWSTPLPSAVPTFEEPTEGKASPYPGRKARKT